MASEATAENLAPVTRAKVFVSYSRSDKAFASDLVLGLTACGFEAYIDREDIAAGEAWEQRLEALIAEADTVVYVLSPDSATSRHCGWELTTSLKLAKRVLPVVWRPVDDATAPSELKRLNYIFFSGEGRSFAAGLAELAQALRVDIGWIREHTRLGELAARWQARGRPATLLLRGDDIDAAIAWRDGKPMSAAAITDVQADFIKASADARAEADRKARAARWGLLAAVSAVAVAMTALAGVAAWQWQKSETAAKIIRDERDIATFAREQMNRDYLRLNAPIELRTAPAKDGYFVIDKGWYLVAANFSGAVARVDRSGGGRRASASSGFVIDGALVHPRFAGQALLLAPAGRESDDAILAPPLTPTPGTPRDTLPADAPLQPQRMIMSDKVDNGPAAVSVSFPTLDGAAMKGTEIVWKTPDYMGGVYPFELWQLDGKLPFGARAIGLNQVDCQDFERTPPERIVGSFSIAVPTEGGPGTKAVSLNIGELLDRTDPYSISYTHATNYVAEGAPVFDFSTGSVFAIHIQSGPDAQRPGRRKGYGTSLRLILDMARQQVKDAELGPTCK